MPVSEFSRYRFASGWRSLALIGFATAFAACSSMNPATTPSTAQSVPSLKLSPRTSGTKGYEVLFGFGSSVYGYDGAFPAAGLIDVDGTLYGTTSEGGGSSDEYGYGTVFSITLTGVETVLHTFNGTTDGAWPAAGLVASNGTLYGTTGGDGVYGSTYGYGTVFALSTTGKHFRVLHTFGGTSDGSYPLASLTAENGKLYGTTSAGGAYGAGTVFSITRNGKETVLHSFSVPQGYRGPDGGSPRAGLIAIKGTLYGTTEFGGTDGTGTVFGMSRTGTLTMLYSFNGGLPAARDPVAGLVYVNHTLYGTTYYGGADDDGTVFGITPGGTDERVLYSFLGGADGSHPAASLAYLHRELYGTASDGGVNDTGTIFSITTTGKERTVHNFGIVYDDGYRPLAGLLDVNGTLYTTAQLGGVNLPSCPRYGDNCDYGTVVALTP